METYNALTNEAIRKRRNRKYILQRKQVKMLIKRDQTINEYLELLIKIAMITTTIHFLSIYA